MRQVLALARTYGQGTALAATPPGAAGVIAARWALAQVGTPYAWGGQTPAPASTAPG